MYDTFLFNQKQGGDPGTAAFTANPMQPHGAHGMGGAFGTIDPSAVIPEALRFDHSGLPGLDASDNTAVTNINIPT
jgi:hypothetical protein